MVGKRGVYLNFLAAILLLSAVILADSVFLNGILPDFIYRISLIKKVEDTEKISETGATEALQIENTALRRQLGVQSAGKPDLKIARVISIERNSLVSTLVINLGSDDGVQKGMPVISAGNILAGKISEVFIHSSRVMLADDPRFTASVRLARSSVLAESKGILGNKVAFDLIAHAEEVLPEQVFYTSGFDQFSPGLAVGEATDIKPGGSLFQKISGRLIFNLYESPFLFIIF